MDTSDIILWTVIVMVYAVTVGPLIARFWVILREGREKEEERTSPDDTRERITLSLPNTDRRILAQLAQDRQQSIDDVAMQALRLGIEGMVDKNPKLDPPRLG